MAHIELLNEDVQLTTTYTFVLDGTEDTGGGGGGGCGCDTYVCVGYVNVECVVHKDCGDYCCHCAFDWY